jgi:hypothetical protein
MSLGSALAACLSLSLSQNGTFLFVFEEYRGQIGCRIGSSAFVHGSTIDVVGLSREGILRIFDSPQTGHTHSPKRPRTSLEPHPMPADVDCQ